MNVRSRLARLEHLVEEILGSGPRCSTCGAPIPSIPEVMLIGKEGIYALAPPCEECSGLGGEGAVPIDVRTGRPTRPIKLQGLEVDEDEWFALHGHRSFGQPWDRFLDQYRPEGGPEPEPPASPEADDEARGDNESENCVFYFPNWPYTRTPPFQRPSGR